ncbi:hypothetical protein, partial [Acrocarpospora pleiomorpha]
MTRISEEAINSLAMGGGGDAVVGELRAVQWSKHRLLVLAVVREAARVGHPHAEMAERAFAALS